MSTRSTPQEPRHDVRGVIELRETVVLTYDYGIDVKASVSTAFFCPYEESVLLSETQSIDTVTLVTTMEMFHPVQIDDTLAIVRDDHPMPISVSSTVSRVSTLQLAASVVSFPMRMSMSAIL